MDERFVPLADSLRRAHAEVETPPARPEQALPPEAAARQPGEAGPLFELALLRLAALEAYERACGGLLEELARSVLARELMLAPADVAALAAHVVERFAEAEPVALRVSPADAETFASELPVRVDPDLGPGDLLVVVRDGALDARFALRLEDALGRVRPALAGT